MSETLSPNGRGRDHRKDSSSHFVFRPTPVTSRVISGFPLLDTGGRRATLQVDRRESEDVMEPEGESVVISEPVKVKRD